MAASGPLSFVFTDIEASTERWNNDADAMDDFLRRHDRIIRGLTSTNRGTIVKHTGDGFLLVFEQAVDAVRASIDIQLDLSGQASSRDPRVRIGIDTGVAAERDGDYFGRTVNRAARIMDSAPAGAILVSSVTAGRAGDADAFPSDARLLEVGEFDLKGFESRERVFQIQHPRLAAAGPVRGRQLGRWTLVSCVEVAGDDQQWEALDRDTGVIADVVFTPHQEPGFAAAVAARIVALRHAGAASSANAQITEHHAEVGGDYIVTERALSGSLSDRLRLFGPQSRAECHRLVEALSGALADLHAFGVAHGAVVLTNVVFDVDELVLLANPALGSRFAEASPAADRAALVDLAITSLSEADRVALKTEGVLQRVDLGSDEAVTALLAWLGAGDHGPHTRATRLPVELRHSERRAFVGREEELGQIGDAWSRAREGLRQVVVVSGEAGVGKTRLVAEAARRLAEDGARVMFGRSGPEESDSYEPFVQALRGFVGGLGADDAADPAQAVTHLGSAPGALRALLPELDDLLPVVDTPTDPAAARQALHDAVISWVNDTSRAEPVVFVLDDLQWASDAVARLVTQLLDWPSPARLMVLVTIRSEDLDPAGSIARFVARCRRRPGAASIELLGLDHGGVLELLSDAAGHDLDSQASAGFVETVLAQTAGNPFYVTELASHLAETGVIERRGDRWSLAVRSDASMVPSSVSDVVGERLGRLSPDAVTLVESAAVIGSDLTFDLWRSMSALDGSRFGAAAAEVLTSGLMEEQGAGAHRVRFAHGIVQSVVLQRMHGFRKAELHHTAALGLQARMDAGFGEVLDDLARHHALGASVGDARVAYDVILRAADAARQRNATDAVVEHLGRAVQLGRDGLVPFAPDESCDLLLALARAEHVAGVPTAKRTVIAAGRLAIDAGDERRLLEAAQSINPGLLSGGSHFDEDAASLLEAALDAPGSSDPAIRADLTIRLAMEFLPRFRERDRVLDLAIEALDLAAASGDHPVTAKVLAGRLAIDRHPSQFTNRLGWADQLAESGKALADPHIEFLGAMWDFDAALTLGLGDRADADLAAMAELAERMPEADKQWRLLRCRATVAALTGQLAEAERLSNASYAIGRRARFEGYTDVYWTQLFVIRFFQGRLDEFAVTSAQGAERGLPSMVSGLAALHAEAGRLDDARRTLDSLFAEGVPPILDIVYPATVALAAVPGDHLDAVRIAHELLAPHRGVCVSAIPYWWGSTSHYLGLLEAALGDLDAADESFAEAADVHAQMGAVPWLALTQIEWARALRTRGDGDDIAKAEELRTAAAATAEAFGFSAIERRVRDW